MGSQSDLTVVPELAEVESLAKNYNLIPLRFTYIDDHETPVSAFLKLRGSGPAFLLESADQGQRFGRYSFIGFQPRATLRYEDGVLTELGQDGAVQELNALPDPYAAVDRYMEHYKPVTLPGLPPFVGGVVGLFGYDLVRTVEPLGAPNPDTLGLPDMALMVTDALVVFDHLTHELTVLANLLVEDGVEPSTGYAKTVEVIESVYGKLQGPLPAAELGSGNGAVKFESNMEQSEFEGMVSRIIEYVHAGDAFQVVPSQRWSAPSPVSPFSIYRGLRAVNPSPYLYYLDFGDFALAGASPEPLLKVEGRKAGMRPIAGTKPRGETPEQDQANAEAMLRDEKERAEHIMLVDLTRNDLGRVCEFGSVEVTELMAVERYSHVMHIVSQVDGQLREGISGMDALRSVLPAGTLSGAPKVRAMQIIDELEPVKRGPYGGAVGYLGYNGDLDTCIHIRTVVVKDGVAHVQAGGGTVADAKPDYEYRESLNKAKAVFAAVELAAKQPGWE